MIRPKVQIKGDLKASHALLAAYDKAKGSYFTIGVHEDAGSYSGRNGSGPAVWEVSWWLELGTKRMPARPFMRPAVADNLESIKQRMLKVLEGASAKTPAKAAAE